MYNLCYSIFYWAKSWGNKEGQGDCCFNRKNGTWFTEGFLDYRLRTDGWIKTVISQYATGKSDQKWKSKFMYERVEVMLANYRNTAGRKRFIFYPFFFFCLSHPEVYFFYFNYLVPIKSNISLGMMSFHISSSRRRDECYLRFLTLSVNLFTCWVLVFWFFFWLFSCFDSTYFKYLNL